jgi:hypothetical protein
MDTPCQLLNIISFKVMIPELLSGKHGEGLMSGRQRTAHRVPFQPSMPWLSDVAATLRDFGLIADAR